MDESGSKGALKRALFIHLGTTAGLGSFSENHGFERFFSWYCSHFRLYPLVGDPKKEGAM